MDDPIWMAAVVYLGLGLAVALPFLTFGIDRVDPAAEHAYAARALLLPGIVMLWPVVALRWAMLARDGR